MSETPPEPLHSDLKARDDASARSQDGARLSHAEAVSRPLAPKQYEAQPTGAADPGKGRIDHAEAAGRFIAAPEHLKFHDERLWDVRTKRDREMHGIPEWEELRRLASAIKEHTLSHLDTYLEQFEAAATANGVHVHWAKDAAEHNEIVIGLLRDHGAKTLIKSKSMLTEECGMRHALADAGIEMTETDLGERIQQLDDEAPSHIVMPAVHKLRRDISDVFARTLGTEKGNEDIHYLAESQRMTTRPLILGADAGMTGGNFIIAETGAVVVCTNEGNADLSANTPKLHVASVGIEKLLPRTSDLGVFIRLLSRSALGSPITQYTSHFRAPRAGAEMHIVLVDNGRSARLGMPEFWTSLKCIRCGACMNTCPVYRRSGGLSYGFTYAGPIGLVIDPTFDKHKFSSLPFASTLNGSCTNVCPVKINLHEQIYGWRKVMAESHELPFVKKTAMAAAGALLASPRLYRVAIATADQALLGLPRFAQYNALNAWGKGRENPRGAGQSFHAWWAKNRAGKPKAVKGDQNS
jgi:L-lactate dehydrogenase complex protein LldF